MDFDVERFKPVSPCLLCGAEQVSLLSERSRNGGKLRTVICMNCGLVWSDPFPHNPRQFYQDQYRLAYKQTYQPKAKHIVRAGGVALTRHQKIKSLLAERQQVLDVGAGGGEFAYLLKALGHDVYGIEPNQGYAEYAKAQYALNLQQGFIQDADFAGQQFDLITIWHVLEHTENPLQVLNKLASLLRADGTLIVEVPNIEATCQAPSSTFHEAHLFNFNLASLSKMAEKAGLLVDRHLFSADGGNLTLFLHQSAAEKVENGAIPGNAERIAAICKAHTTLRHYLTVKPYLRFLRKMARSWSEQQQVQGVASQDLLDQLYRHLL